MILVHLFVFLNVLHSKPSIRNLHLILKFTTACFLLKMLHVAFVAHLYTQNNSDVLYCDNDLKHIIMKLYYFLLAVILKYFTYMNFIFVSGGESWTHFSTQWKVFRPGLRSSALPLNYSDDIQPDYNLFTCWFHQICNPAALIMNITLRMELRYFMDSTYICEISIHIYNRCIWFVVVVVFIAT